VKRAKRPRHVLTRGDEDETADAALAQNRRDVQRVIACVPRLIFLENPRCGHAERRQHGCHLSRFTQRARGQPACDNHPRLTEHVVQPRGFEHPKGVLAASNPHTGSTRAVSLHTAPKYDKRGRATRVGHRLDGGVIG
jgi:hypothetical protein